GATINMLAGGSGEFTVDSLDSNVAQFYLNFETGNQGIFTFGSNYGTTSASSAMNWLVSAGHVSIDGVADTDFSSYSIVNDGLSSSIALIPEPASLGLIGLVGVMVLGIRRIFVL
ncbi:MAG: PEP-CTERM sorting domain-containing protein, partial [Verrucomicrobiota bacterium]|nr:PEP-CTERM sorting domain-containing protein [Verrucomicrobiota bacterium]